MKKMFVIASIFAVAVITLRRFGSAVAKRAMAKCEEMMGTRAEAREELIGSRTSPEESAERVTV
ncbi:MAG TPA: hypothetical protein VFI59_09585 [Actinomycetota bacterium]|nr:hypothetical protein [Actinomycetota bacterium]